MLPDSPRPRPAAPLAPGRSDPLPLWRSEELFRGAAEIRLLHADVEYRLRVTRQGKLILTK